MPDVTSIPLSVYVHLPWCLSKCPYCDFNSRRLKGALPETAYIDALLADLRIEAARCQGRPVVSVFLGGGTPSLFPPAAIARLLQGIGSALELQRDAEVTMEANPGSLECGRLAGYRAAGINRLSIGVQSFDDTSLKALGRVHSAATARAAIAEALDAGFDGVNIDLMFGLPGQTRSNAEADIDAALDLAPAHISHYQLTLEPNTVFHRHPPVLPNDDACWAMQAACAGRLAAAGYEHYEVSAFARAGAQCRHNLNYWTFGDYLGIGAGAHGKLSHGDGIQRRWKLAHPAAYMRAAGDGAIAGEHTLGASDAGFEFMLNALRLREGFEATTFAERTGQPLQTLAAPLAEAQSRGLLSRDEAQRWRPTPLGQRFLNDLQALFLPEAPDTAKFGYAENAGLQADGIRARAATPQTAGNP